MTLADIITQPVSYEATKELAIILTQPQAAILSEIQEQYGNPKHIADPVLLTNGKLMLCADLLTEIGENGLYASGFSHLPQNLFNEVEVVSMIEAVDLIIKIDNE